VQKRREYAEAGIPEYWIVDPSAVQVTVLRLEEDVYVEHGVFRRGTQATSVLLDGFAVAVDRVLDAV
jgi:Uma2 family endonuclease